METTSGRNFGRSRIATLASTCSVSKQDLLIGSQRVSLSVTLNKYQWQENWDPFPSLGCFFMKITQCILVPQPVCPWLVGLCLWQVLCNLSLDITKQKR